MKLYSFIELLEKGIVENEYGLYKVNRNFVVRFNRGELKQALKVVSFQYSDAINAVYTEMSAAAELHNDSDHVYEVYKLVAFEDWMTIDKEGV